MPGKWRDYRELAGVYIHKDVLAAAERCAEAEDSDLDWLVEQSLKEMIRALDETRADQNSDGSPKKRDV